MNGDTLFLIVLLFSIMGLILWAFYIVTELLV